MSTVTRIEETQYWPRTIRSTPEGVVSGFQQTAVYRHGGPTGGHVGTEGRLVGPHYVGELLTELSPWVYRRTYQD